MLSSVLRSERAVRMNILIMPAFVRLREMIATHKDLARATEDIGRRQSRNPTGRAESSCACQRHGAITMQCATCARHTLSTKKKAGE